MNLFSLFTAAKDVGANVIQSLHIMWKGVLAIFIVIAIIIIAVAILNKITATLAIPKEERKAKREARRAEREARKNNTAQ